MRATFDNDGACLRVGLGLEARLYEALARRKSDAAHENVDGRTTDTLLTFWQHKSRSLLSRLQFADSGQLVGERKDLGGRHVQAACLELERFQLSIE
ncbi:MAG: hypothetical protein AAAC50_25610 [Rhizobium altiplani]|uniref:hypothetical protein n=1 Tax=Rhizobium altiplani TaxID=1864509 RepID=UPI0013AF52FE